MSNLISIATAMYCDPWLIEPSMHKVLCTIVENHIKGGEAEKAQRLLGMSFDEQKEEKVEPYQVIDGIAVIPLYGVIGRRVGRLERSSGVTDVDVFSRAIVRAMGDPMVQKIMIDVDSPGGTVGGVQNAADTVRKASEVKKTMAFTGGTMASAAYWIASGASVIYADETSSVGSIGVYTMILDSTRYLDNLGLKQQVFSSGKYKAAGADGTSLTDEQKAQIQSRVDDLFAIFKDEVRRYNPAIADDTMQGQVFLGAKSVDAGLVNSVASFSKALEDLRNW